MPNYCSNYVSVAHQNPVMMETFKAGVDGEKLFEMLLPLQSHQDERSDSISVRGTKWDVSNGGFHLSDDGLSGRGFFDTAWSPPIAAYEALRQLGFQIVATYHEPGLCFAGAWSNEDGSDHYEYDFEESDWRDVINNPKVLELLNREYEVWLSDCEDDE